MRHPLLELAGQVRDDPDHALDEHQLPAVVHLVFLDRKDHLKAAAARWFRHGCLDLFGQEVVRESLDPACPLVSFLAQQVQDLRLVARLALFYPRALEKTGKVEPRERQTPFDGVNLVGPSRRDRDIRQYFGHASRFLGSPEAVFVLGKVLRDQERVLPDSAETLRQLL